MAETAQAAKRAPVNIAYETENCTVRELEPDDACETIAGWLADPETARALNAKPRAIGMDELRAYIASFNRVNGHLLGIFDRKTGAIVGFWEVYIDWEHSEFLLNVLVAERIAGDFGALKESGRPLYDFMFYDLDLETMRYNVLASNARMQARLREPILSKLNGPEHSSAVASAAGPQPETILHYRMTRAQHLEIRAQRAERDAEWRAKKAARAASS